MTIFANGTKTPVDMTREVFVKIENTISAVLKPLLDHLIDPAEEEVTVEVLLATEAYCAEVNFPPSKC